LTLSGQLPRPNGWQRQLLAVWLSCAPRIEDLRKLRQGPASRKILIRPPKRIAASTHCRRSVELKWHTSFFGPFPSQICIGRVPVALMVVAHSVHIVNDWFGHRASGMTGLGINVIQSASQTLPIYHRFQTHWGSNLKTCLLSDGARFARRIIVRFRKVDLYWVIPCRTNLCGTCF
jgi:hypothetical protein